MRNIDLLLARTRLILVNQDFSEALDTNVTVTSKILSPVSVNYSYIIGHLLITKTKRMHSIFILLSL